MHRRSEAAVPDVLARAGFASLSTARRARLGARCGPRGFSLAANAMRDDEHLRDVCNLEHLPVVERLVRLEDGGQIDELCGEERVAQAEDGAA